MVSLESVIWLVNRTDPCGSPVQSAFQSDIHSYINNEPDHSPFISLTKLFATSYFIHVDIMRDSQIPCCNPDTPTIFTVYSWPSKLASLFKQAQSGSDVFKEEVQEWTIPQSLEMEHPSSGCWTEWALDALFIPTDLLHEDSTEHRTPGWDIALEKGVGTLRLSV